MRYQIGVVKKDELSFLAHVPGDNTEAQARALFRDLRRRYPESEGFVVSAYQMIRVEEIAEDITEEMLRRIAADPYEVQPVEIGVI